ncbi:MAG: FtsX-like permease family protein, partial [Pseudomonas stutzeri]|nr:FtsX-like permease family protein [Stutzerimonas stutzeri]NIO13057.1 FtsX-like permease family protein [Xanthomonadales bacterium]
ERHREIGIHRAHGATSGAIARTFLLESLSLGAVGGLGGVGLGFLGVRYL